jgi:hypothetical protein
MEPQENKKIYDASKSNFFPSLSNNSNIKTDTDINSIPQQVQIQSFPPNENQLNQQQLQQEKSLLNLNMPILQNPQQEQKQNQSQQSFFEKINSTASGVIDYIKSKAPPLPTNIIPKNLLDKVDPLTIISEIKIENFEKILGGSVKDIDCLKLEKTKLNDLTILVKISNPRQINNSLFSTNYVLYDISTPQFNWLVNRRYSDFIWLKDCLKNLFPGDVLPILPKKKIGNRRFEENFLNKRTQGLQKFLNDIVNNEKYKATEVLNIFLSCAERNLFEQQMKTISPKLLFKKNVQEIQNFEGKNKIINLNFDNENDIITHFNSVYTYLNGQNELLENLQRNLSNYKKCMTEACHFLEEVENNFSKLSMMLTKVNISEKMNNTYENYEIFFKNWKKIQANQCCIIKDMVKNFFKDIRIKSEALVENLEKAQNLQEEYLSQKIKLMAKKELLWKQMDVSKWELNQTEEIDSNKLFHDKLYAQDKMCFKENIDLNIKAQLLGYYFYHNHNNFKLLIDELNKSYVTNINDFSNQIYPSLTDGINAWSDLVTHIKKN